MFRRLTTLSAWKRSSRSAPRSSRCGSPGCSPRAGGERREPQLAAWSAGLAAYALGAAAIAWGAAAGWNEGVFRAYYLFGGLLTAALLGAGSLLGAGVRAAGAGRARLHRARDRRRARRAARGAGQRHGDPGSAGAPRASSPLGCWRSPATRRVAGRWSASPWRGSAGARSGTRCSWPASRVAALGSALAGLGAAQTAAFVAVAACLLYAGSVART